MVFPDGDSCVLMWRLGQVACFLDASSIWSSPVFCIRGTENWEGQGGTVGPDFFEKDLSISVLSTMSPAHQHINGHNDIQ